MRSVLTGLAGIVALAVIFGTGATGPGDEVMGRNVYLTANNEGPGTPGENRHFLANNEGPGVSGKRVVVPAANEGPGF
ncbi:hypothetical protein ACIBEA_28100 [Streptomyces sp. NPDC051555]|uniref:hypothetical protein n=1 Tax=Streptomyces sp. NPDC051555 TaxID=3365657 RepID=UPI00379E7CF3